MFRLHLRPLRPLTVASPLHYAIALLSSTLAALVTWWIVPLREEAPILLFAAVVVSAWYGGLGPALLATLITALADDFLLVPPYFAFNFGPEDTLRVGVFTAVALLASVLVEARRQAETRAQTEWAQLNLMLASIGDGLIATDTQGRVTFMNLVAQALSGWTEAAALGQELNVVLPLVNEQTREAIANPALQAIHSGRIIGLANHTALIAVDGKERPIEQSSAPMHDAQGSISGAVLVFRDIAERRQAKLALAHLAALVESSTDAIIGKTLDGTIQSWNAGAEQIYGYTAAEVRGRSVALLIPPESTEELPQLLQRLANGEQIAHYETIRLRKDGTRIDVSLTISPIRDAAGQLVGASAIARDITERKRAEAALTEERNLLRMLIDTIPDEIYIKNAQGQFLNANTTVARIHGLSTSDQLIGKTDFDLRKPYEQALADYRAEQAILHSGEPMINRETSSHDKTEWRLETKIPLRDSQGQIVGLVGVNRLITERKRAEEALRQAEQRYRDLFEEAPVMYVITHNRGGMPIIADCNAEFCNTLGYARAELLGKPLADFYTPDSRNRLADGSYEQALAGTFSDQERALVTCDGRAIQTILRAVPEPAHDGQIVGTRAMYIDISERKRAVAMLEAERALLAQHVAERTAELRAANADLVHAAQIKDEFLAGMSHELRTPLNAILGLSEALQEQIYGTLSGEQLRVLCRIEESGHHLLALINDILDLSKIEAGKLELDCRPVDLAAVCQHSVQFIKPAALRKQITVTITPDPAVATVVADERRLKQILVNLLSNAVKFTSAGGAIGVEAVGDPAQQQVHLTVWDTGTGIAPSDLERLFQPFIQVDNALTRQYEGSGLGLALVDRMVTLHGGRVAVTSTVGVGSRFTVSLPWQPTDQETEIERARWVPGISGPRLSAIRQALLIEDSATAAAVLSRYLNELGITTVTRTHGANSVATALTVQPDVILLDILLPGRSGWEVLSDLKADPGTRHIPVLIVSVTDERSRALGLGASACLVKPITREQLQQTLGTLGGHAAEDVVQLATRASLASVRVPPKILLVEDNETNITTVGDYLQARQYQVVVARNGAEAIERAREVQPDVILMDVQMPVMDGLEAMRRIRAAADLSEVPIIALTARAMASDRERCLAAGATAYLSKPLSLKGLVETIEISLHDNHGELGKQKRWPAVDDEGYKGHQA